MKPIILCAGQNGRAVLFGRVETDPVPGQPVTLHGARMVLMWSAECGGLLGLAAKGPRTSTRMTAVVPYVIESVWQEAIGVEAEAAKEMDRWPAAA